MTTTYSNAGQQSTSTGSGQSSGQSSGQQSSQSTSNSYIPDYSQTPILESIAQYAANMAPQVYQWGMQQYANNQGQINQLLNTGASYASPQKIAADMGQAEAGVTQAGESALDNSKRDLESYGIDPSSGRYAALDAGERVQNAASAVGAANQQRNADIATGQALTQAGISASEQNMAQGVNSENAANQYLGTGMQLKYSPLGTTSQQTSEGTNESTNESTSSNISSSGPKLQPSYSNQPAMVAGGGYMGAEDSPSGGEEVDDIDAKLDAGEYVIPRDVVEWKGHEFFDKLLKQARERRVKAGKPANSRTSDEPKGYHRGGRVGSQGGFADDRAAFNPGAGIDQAMAEDRAAFAPSMAAGGYFGGV